ncbi:hypothetical protein [Geodermatophilus normandii]|uniref:Uncharacterized protein n=1 Tax=Geodermatophilus normandii TaxID=1137989 RepID=A0A6P0GF87_9ACTN|nr:hypothetical protein [Geodermatophilus normandii]NEM05928.1 hypothetical protein [Geodermatophilus normandii]
MRRLAEGRGLPAGRTADARRLLAHALAGEDRVLVLGPAGVVRQALPTAALDVAGTNPHQRDVTVVSAAEGEGSLPRRWRCVVVTDADPAPGRLRAAAGAAVPGGALVVVGPAADRVVDLPGTRLERTARRGSVQVVTAQVVP